jgi:hypothetical protein
VTGSINDGAAHRAKVLAALPAASTERAAWLLVLPAAGSVILLLGIQRRHRHGDRARAADAGSGSVVSSEFGGQAEKKA